MPEFVHLHCHTQYSLLDGASDIATMMDKAVRDGQKGVALTDHGNMFGAFKFVAEANKRGLKPIVGCEFYLVNDRHKKSFSRAKGEMDKRFHQLLLAKNKKGYENLSKLCSLGYIEGLYSKYPRIDKELIEKYHEGLIATSCCIGAEIPQTILRKGAETADELLKWWLDIFGEDYYIELQRHKGLENIDNLGVSQEDVNQTLLQFAEKYDLKVIATNDAHYVEEEDWKPHDILLCINTNSLIEEVDRFRFSSTDYYFKTQQQMNQLFSDVPQSLDTTMEIFDKVEKLDLKRDILLPAFPVPKGYKTQDDYLRHLTFEGAKRRYGSVSEKIRERLNFELEVIKNSGHPGYFLIVQDFTTAARRMGVAVGPGRGSAAGSVVAYCIGITNVDPIKYDLLFERFLNPERVSMPDIDMDFDDHGREKVIQYVIDKYGKNQVAQIITYGKMAAKMSLRDVGRVMDVPLNEVNRVTKIFPSLQKATLAKVLSGKDIDPDLKSEMNSEDVEKANQFRKIAAQNDQVGKMIQTARKLEGSVRNTGTHACGVIITPDDIVKYVPVSTAKDSDLLVSQFDLNVVEDAGLLKMDFLGLKTLSIIKDAIKLVKQTNGLDIDPDAVPLEDEKTYELFKRGETIGIFQYESSGMQKYLKELAPNKFDDLIAMNALYRPGPMSYIPDFVARKHGRQTITYDLPEMKEYLEETYGITVYQEQVMLLSQKLAGFSKGEADSLRKAMGKKKKSLIDELYPKFIAGCEKNGHPKKVVEKIWTDWEAFASYAFNKSHATCYALVAFQTAYLKAHFPAEFMASVLTHNKGDISKVTFFLRECKRMGLEVLGPGINESESDFSVNKQGQIRFGLSALKGVGEGPVEGILQEREQKGPYKSLFDMMRRLNLRSVNKKALESLILSGGLDCFEDVQRWQYFSPSGKYETLIEHALRYGHAYQLQKAQTVNSLFGDSEDVMLPEPPVPQGEAWSLIEKLTKEKEVTGIYISGHPLDDYRVEIQAHANCPLEEVENRIKGQILKIAGIVTAANHRISKKGTGWGVFTLQDYNGSLEFPMFTDDYQKFKSFFEIGQVLFVQGKMEKRWNRDEYQFKVKDICLLESVGENLTKSVTVKLDIENITKNMVNDLEKLCTKYKGKHQFKMTLLDQTQKTSLTFASKKRKVTADNDFCEELENMGLEFRVN